MSSTVTALRHAAATARQRLRLAARHTPLTPAEDTARAARTAQAQARRRLLYPSGTPRTSELYALTPEGLLRHTDGSFTKAYAVTLPATLYAEETVVARLYQDWAAVLQRLALPGCVLQLRHEVAPDPGHALHAHLAAQAPPADTFLPARWLHTLGLAGLEAKLQAGQYQSARLTLWLRVPARVPTDPRPHFLTQTAAYFPALARELRRQGLLGSARALATAWHATASPRLLRRAQADEAAARAQAQQVWATLEQLSPLTLHPLTRTEVWQEVWRSHRLSHPVAPTLPPDSECDLRPLLCGETLAADGSWLLHGDVPVTLLTLFRPPTPVVTAGLMRLLTANPQLTFRHTTVVEYLTLDQDQAKARLHRQLQDLSRAQTATGRKSPTPHTDDPDAQAAQQDLAQLRADLAGGRAALLQARLYALVYGPRVTHRAALPAALETLDHHCRTLLAALGRLPGADVAREEPAALRALYPQTLAGALSPQLTGREITETAQALACLAPLESVWAGAPRPHTLVPTPSQHLIGLDLFDPHQVPAPLGLVLAGSRGGKSVWLAELITNALATLPHLRVQVVDYGQSQAPLVAALGGRQLAFDPQRPATLNIWDYPGLEHGQPPSELQKWYVVQDALHLARVAATGPGDPYARFAEDILTLLVREVYANEVPRNRPGRPKHEPRHEHLLEMLATYRFDDPQAEAVRTQLRLALETLRGDPWLDAATAPELVADSPLTVYELKSLENFSERVRQSLAFRLVARLMQSEGHRQPDGTRRKMLLVFDEMWAYLRHYPQIVAAIERYARTGGKEGVLTLLATQAFKDITGTEGSPNPIGHALMANVGVKFIGRQTGDYEDLVAKFKLSAATVVAIDSVRHAPGHYAEMVGIWGAGTQQQGQKFRVELHTPLKLWTYTSQVDERNARAQVAAWRPEWTPLQGLQWLAEHYPQGLVAAGLREIDATLLHAAV